MPQGKESGTVSFSLGGVDASSPAHWIEQLESMGNTFTDVWVSGISEDDQGGRSEVSFSSTATLAPGVVSNRASAWTVPR
jgi:hypothetical protein